MSDTPDDLAQALQAVGLVGFFTDCTKAHRREYLKWINEAKRPETRAHRIAQTVKLLQGKSAKERASKK